MNNGICLFELINRAKSGFLFFQNFGRYFFLFSDVVFFQINFANSDFFSMFVIFNYYFF